MMIIIYIYIHRNTYNFTASPTMQLDEVGANEQNAGFVSFTHMMGQGYITHGPA